MKRSVFLPLMNQIEAWDFSFYQELLKALDMDLERLKKIKDRLDDFTQNEADIIIKYSKTFMLKKASENDSPNHP